MRTWKISDKLTMSLSPPYWSGLVAVPKISSPVTLKGIPDRNILLRDRIASSLIACFFSSGNLEEIQLRNRGQAQVLVHEVYDLLSKHGICLTWSQLDAIQTPWRTGLLTPVLRSAPSVPNSFLKSLCLPPCEVLVSITRIKASGSAIAVSSSEIFPL
jgi:hypothetical protein